MYDPNQVAGAVAPEEVLSDDSVATTDEQLLKVAELPEEELVEVSDEVSDEVLAEELGVEEDFTV